MVTSITRGELAALIPNLPAGDLRDWCELSSAGLPGQLVYADGGMLSRCREAAGLSQESNSSESNNEELQRQPGAEMDAPTDIGEGPQVSREAGD